jgi:hypothetical protein
MNKAVEEIKADTTLIEELCAGVGKMSMALMAATIRNQAADVAEIADQLKRARDMIRDQKQAHDELRALCGKFQEQTKASIQIVQNQIDGVKQ